MRNPRRGPIKYRDCEYVSIHGGTSRLLTPAEVAEWDRRIAELRNRKANATKSLIANSVWEDVAKKILDRLDEIEARLAEEETA